MKKGFTLIELLAVIVILAIIALIATPIVLNIINDAKESSTLRSAEFYLDGVDQAILTATLNNKSVKDGTYNIMEDGNICIGKLEDKSCNEDENIPDSGYVLEVNVNGEKPKEGTIAISSGEVSNMELTISDKEIWTDPFTGEIAHKLAPGLYDENDKLLMSWDELNEKALIETESFEINSDFESLIVNGDVYQDDYGNPFGFAGKIIDSISGAYKLVISNKITMIGDSSFLYSSNLKEVIIPNSVESIEGSAFGASGLVKIVIPSSVKTIGSFAFSDSDLVEVTLPGSITSVGTNAFTGCTNLNSVRIQKGITGIEGYTFSECNNLTNVTIEDGVTDIGYSMFLNCNKLTTIIIPDSIKEIDHDTFVGCSSLTIIYYKGTASGATWGAENAVVDSNF